MANINEYVALLKQLNKLIDNAQFLLGPNLHDDIIMAKNTLKSLRHNLFIMRHNIKKSGRLFKIKKHKRNKKNFVK